MELIRTGWSISGALESLLDDLPSDAFPGEGTGEVLLEIVAGTCAPVIAAAGEDLCRGALTLIAAIGEKFLSDLRTAADLASAS